MRIAIATVGRFHVLDLARELSTLGHQVAFWSLLPRSRAVRFGLPPEAHRGLLPSLFPLVALQRYGGRQLARMTNPHLMTAVDQLIARRLEPCDIFIGMSGLAIESARAARQRYGARVFIERGSRHILSQKAILDEIACLAPGAETVPDYAVAREEASYDGADVVVVPSHHAFDSFIDQGFSADCLYRNPYGVDLSMFVPTPTPSCESPKVVFAGVWSYQKGCDILADAVSRCTGAVRLVHVGPVGDAPLPRATWFQHLDALPQWELTRVYADAHVFALASRHDGFGLVLAQALASGLPVVCTDRTGGEDLKEILGLDEGVFIVPHDDAEGLAVAIESALGWAKHQFPAGTVRDLLGDKRDRLSWRAYGERYSRKIGEVVAQAV